MKRPVGLLTGAGILAAIIAVLLGGVAYRQFYGQAAGPSDSFYQRDQTSPQEAFSYEAYSAVLSARVDPNGMVDYDALKADAERLNRFARELGWLETETYEQWDQPTRIALWLNAYNALTLKAIVDNYPIKPGVLTSLAFPANSIRQIPGVWDRLTFRVMGTDRTLDQIEHQVLRKRFNEPRIHMALVCAAKGCPPLRREPYRGESLGRQLNDQTRRFLADPTKFRIDRENDVVHLSSIFKWFGKDFVASYKPDRGFGDGSEAQRAVLAFIARYSNDRDATTLRDGEYRVSYLPYDWSLNEQPPRPSKPSR